MQQLRALFFALLQHPPPVPDKLAIRELVSPKKQEPEVARRGESLVYLLPLVRTQRQWLSK